MPKRLWKSQIIVSTGQQISDMKIRPTFGADGGGFSKPDISGPLGIRRRGRPPQIPSILDSAVQVGRYVADIQPLGSTATTQDTSRGFCMHRHAVSLSIIHDVFRTPVEFTSNANPQR